MPDLVVIPEYLNVLATTHDEAASLAGSAVAATQNLETQVWVSQGVVSAPSNVEFTRCENARRLAGEAVQMTSNDLAEKLRAAGDAYERTDQEAGENVGK